MAEKKLINTALVNIMREVKAIGKDRKNASQNYNFRGVDDVMNELHELFAKEGVIILTRVKDQVREERNGKSGGLLLYSLNTYEFELMAEDGSSVIVEQVGEGMDSGDKACNKSASAALKYALLFMFLVPTENSGKDSEEEDHELKASETKQPAEEKKEAAKPEDEKKDLKPDLPLWAKVIAWGKGKDVEVWIRNKGKYEITPEDEKLLFEELGWKIG